MHRKLLKVTWNNSIFSRGFPKGNPLFYVKKEMSGIIIEKSNILLELCNKTTCINLFNKYNLSLEVRIASTFLCVNNLPDSYEVYQYGR